MGIVSSKKPQNTHLFIETTAGVLYLVDSVNTSKLYKSTDKGDNWVEITDRTDAIIYAWYDPTNEIIFFCDAGYDHWYITLSDDSITVMYTALNAIKDIFSISGFPYHFQSWNNAGNANNRVCKGTASAPWVRDCGASHDMGAVGARTWDMGQVAIIETDIYYLWKWSDENVELWKMTWASGAGTNAEMIDCGANTELPPINQRSITYDGVDFLYFVLQDTGDSKILFI